MSINLATADVDVRERRLKAILTYEGSASDLNAKSEDGSLKTSKRAYQQCSDCSQGCAETITYCIKGAAVIVHSPIGCCSDSSAYEIQLDAVSRGRKIEKQNTQIICTNIQEKDTIYGATKKLTDAIDEAYRRFNPTAIFVHSSCAAAIIGDDIESVTDKKALELGIPLVPVFCEGFKSRIWSTGFDAAFHGILRKVVKPPQQKQHDLVNIFNFLGSDSFGPLLAKMGLRANYLVPLADIKTIERMSEAACTAHICETLATYVATGLEQEYGVPEVRVPGPFGITWTDNWLREIAKHTGKEEVVESVIASEHKRVKPALDEIKKKLDGASVYIFAGDSYAHSLANMVVDLGLKPLGLATLHHDQTTDGQSEDFNTLKHLLDSRGEVENYTICNRQPYQMIKVLKRLKPDLLIVRHMNMTILGTKLGIPTILEGDVNVSAGYDGVIKLGERLHQALRTKRLLQNIAEHVEWPYSSWWLDREEEVYEGKGA